MNDNSRAVSNESNKEPVRGLGIFRGRAMHGTQIILNVPLECWMLIYPQRAGNDTWDFLGMLFQVGNGAKYSIAKPKQIDMKSLPIDSIPTVVGRGTYYEEVKKFVKL